MNELSVNEKAADSEDPKGLLATLRERVFGRSTVIWILLVLLAEIVVFSVVLPSGTFLTGFNLTTILSDSAVILILGTGMTFVIVTAGIDLSLGSLMTLAAVVSSLLMRKIGADGSVLGILLGAGCGIAAASAWGALNGLLAVGLKVPPFVVTLGSFGAALGVSRLLSGGVSVGGLPPGLQEHFGQASVFGLPLPFLLAVVVILGFGLILAKSRFGEWTYIIGSNEEAARRAGVNVKRHLVKVYLLAGCLAGVAGFVDLSRFNSASVSTGHMTELLAAIAAVIIGGTSLFGGTGKMIGTAIAVYIPVVLANGLLIGGIQRFWQDVIIGVILVAAVAFDQWRRDRELAAK